MKEILQKIESSIPENLQLDLKRRIVTRAQSFSELSKQFKNITENNYEIRSALFKNNNDAIYFSGDILTKTFYDFWTKGGEIQDHFVENAQIASYVSNFECLW